MKFHKLISLFLLFGISYTNAQNSLFLEPMKENITNGSLKKIIPKEISDFFDADKYFDFAYQSFTKDHKFTDGNIFINCGFYNDYHFYLNIFKNPDKKPDNTPIFEKLKKTLFSNKTFYEAAYNNLIPHYKTAFSKMTNGETEAYLNAIKAALQYSENFDLKKEMAEEEKLDYMFAYEKGNILAFIYRRIKNNELSKDECIYWLKKIYDDLKSARKVKSGIDNYYLIENSFANYYKAKTYDTLENYIYLIKTEKGYQPLDKNTRIEKRYFNKKNFHLFVNKKSNSEYKIELYGLTESPISLSTSKAIKDVIPALNNDNMFLNYLFINYEDGTTELLNTATNSKTILSAKTEQKIEYSNGFYIVNYADNSFDLIIFDANNYNKKSFDSAFLELISLLNPDEYLLKSKSGEVYYIRNKNSEIVKLAAGINYLTFSYWKNFIIFSESKVEKNNSSEIYKYGVLSNDAKILLEPVYDSFIIPGSESEFILMCKIENGENVCTPFDGNFKRMGNIVYTNVVGITYDAETFEEISTPNTFDAKDKTIIFQSRTDNKDATLTEYEVMLDPKGNAIISEKFAVIQRIEIAQAKNNLYRVLDNYNPENPSAGKWALFNHKGEKLSEFEFDKIGNFEHGLIPAVKKDKFVFFDKDGKITTTGNLKNAENEAGSDIYLLTFGDKTCAVVDKNNSSLSEIVYQQIIDKVVIFDPDNFEETITVVKERIDSTDKTFIIFKNEYGGERIVNQKRVLLNFEGKLLIDQYTERIYFPNAENSLYRVSESSFYRIDPEVQCGPEGKFALFNHLGKQLTKFVYDEISEADNKGLLNASRNGKKVLLDKRGKEVSR
jgi:hypothetical protein